MASYINNIFENARIQDVQAFTPDWNFLSQGQAQLSVIQKKNFADFAQRYNSIIDGQLTREDNIALRDKYKKEADEFVKQVSGMDLTDPRNVKAASSVFQPLVDNKLYIRDIMNTRMIEDAKRKAYAQATSLNPAERDLYNEYSLKQLDYFSQDFANASDTEAINMQAPAYLPGINLEKMALNFFNAQQYDVEIEQDTGKWIIKTKGGQLVQGDLEAGLMAEFMQDPLVKQNIALQSAMEKRDYVEENLPRFNGDRLSAENAYYQDRFSGLVDRLISDGVKVKENISVELQVAEKVAASLENGEASDNQPMSENVQTVRDNFLAGLQNLRNLDAALKQQNLQIASGSQEQVSVSRTNSTPGYSLTIDGKQYTPDQLEAILFQGKISNIASRLAMSRFSQTMKENPYALAQFKANLDWQNKKNELDYEAYLAAQAALPDASETTDLAEPSSDILQGLDLNPEKLVGLDEEGIAKSESEMLTAEAELVKAYIQQNPDYSGPNFEQLYDPKNVNNMVSVIARQKILKEINANFDAGTYNAQTHEVLRNKLTNLQALTKTKKILQKDWKETMRVAINSSTASDDKKELLLMSLEGANTLSELKKEYAEVRAVIMKREDLKTQSTTWNPFKGIPALYSLLKDDYTGDAEEEFDNLINGGQGSGSVSEKYLQIAKDQRGKTLGYNVGAGGVTPYGKDFGQATNTRNTIADQILSGTYKISLSESGVTYATGSLSSNIGNTSGYLDIQDSKMQKALQIMVDQALQNQKENAGTLRTANVQMYEDPATGEQYVYVRPNEAMIGLMYESGEDKASLLSSTEANALLQSGVTIRIPKGQGFDARVFGIQQLTPTQKLFNLQRTVSIGGDMSADGGKIDLTFNNGRFTVFGKRYQKQADGTYKTVTLGSAVEENLNSEYQRLMQARDNQYAIDPALIIVQMAEDYVRGFQAANR
jgi:hypothetical protein